VKFVYRDELWHGADMLSLGVSSFGIIDGTHYQNEANIDKYVERVQKGESPVFRAYTMNDEEKFIREFILQLKLGSIKRSYFKEKYNIDPAVRYEQVLRGYVSEGCANIEPDAIVLTRDGLLQVDRLLHGFFIPQHQTDRIV